MPKYGLEFLVFLAIMAYTSWIAFKMWKGDE